MQGHTWEERCCFHPNAMKGKNGKGRALHISPDPNDIRSEYQRDAHRIIYSQPFRRLRHKTQVFYMPNNDHVCTRIEHSIHVAAAARTAARALGLNEDLAEAIGLGHDLGHAPFGHHGERILDKIAKENGIPQGFSHEVNSLRVVDRLALLDRSPSPGLNLTWEVRDGIVSHCGEDLKTGKLVPAAKSLALEDIGSRKQAGTPTTHEGCLVRLIDKITYAGRDIEDALMANLIDESDIPDELTPILGTKNGEIVGALLTDLINTSRDFEEGVALSDKSTKALSTLLQFNYDRIYLRPELKGRSEQAGRVLRALFGHCLETLQKSERFQIGSRQAQSAASSNFHSVFEDFVKSLKYNAEESDARITLDFLSGFTDNYAVRAFEEVFLPRSVL